MSMLRTLVSLVVTGAMLINLAMATSYTVGGPNGGWDTSTNLQAWASSQSFSAGDNLVFQYMPNHNVLEVTKADHDSCQTSNPLQTYNGGNSVIPLTSPGNRYFICGAMGHCSQGMKVEIDTLATSAPPAASPASLPPTATPPSPTSPVPPESATQPPTSSPMPAPTMSPHSSVSSPAASPSVVPSTESLANSTPSGSVPPPPLSTATTKVNTMVGCSVGFGFAMVILLTL